MKKSVVVFQTAKQNPSSSVVKDIDAEELKEHLAQVHVVDVRRPDELIGELGHIGSAQHILLDTIPDRLNELPKSETVVFVCRSGARSAQATAYALEHGFQYVFNMKGGMLRWNELGFPVER